jgi:hypothetical protein
LIVVRADRAVGLPQRVQLAQVPHETLLVAAHDGRDEQLDDLVGDRLDQSRHLEGRRLPSTVAVEHLERTHRPPMRLVEPGGMLQRQPAAQLLEHLVLDDAGAAEVLEDGVGLGLVALAEEP